MKRSIAFTLALVLCLSLAGCETPQEKANREIREANEAYEEAQRELDLLERELEAVQRQIEQAGG